MKNSSLYYPLIDTSVRMVNVKFISSTDGSAQSRDYTYKSRVPLKVDDYALVEARGWYSVVKVVRTGVPIPMNCDDIAYRWVVCRIDFDAHKELLEEEQRLIDRFNDFQEQSMRARVLEALGLTAANAENLLADVRHDDGVTDDDDATDAD